MSILEKQYTSKQGTMQGHRKCSDGFSEFPNAGSFMDDTDREVSNLTERAFRSLCIGEDAIYNDLEVSSPSEQRIAFAQQSQQNKDLKNTCQESVCYSAEYWKDGKSKVDSTFQHSHVDVKKQALREENLSYMSNGSVEAMWQERRSTSRVSSLIKAFTTGDGYINSSTPETQHLLDNYRDLNNESWEKSAVFSIQKEVSNFSSINDNRRQSSNNFQAAVTQTSTMKARFMSLNSTNFFFHSEFSPFQLWKDYSRIHFGRGEVSRCVSDCGFSRWYDPPLYKELTAPHRQLNITSETRKLNQRQNEYDVASQQFRCTVVQKASAIEKRCESEMASNCPPWKRTNSFVRNKLPSNRPSTVSPTNEKTHRPDSSLLYYSKHAYDIQHQVRKVVSGDTSNSSTPFNITQLLTPVIPKRQGTETSEILQSANTPSVLEYSPYSDADHKSLTENKQLRASYKSKASSLLFNLKDNRKRVKSTYSPTKFKSMEIPDLNKTFSMGEENESTLSHNTESKTKNPDHAASQDTWGHCNASQLLCKDDLIKSVEHEDTANGSNEQILESQYGTTKCNMYNVGSYNNALNPDKVSNRENDFAPQRHSALGNYPEKQSEKEHSYSNAYTLEHMSTQLSAKHTFYQEEDVDVKVSKNFIRKPNYVYSNNQMIKEENQEVINIINKGILNNGKNNGVQFKGEIASLIEMDKQKRATARQDLPLVKNTMEKETYINRMNESIKQSRLAKQKELQNSDSNSFSNTQYSSLMNGLIQDDPKSQTLYGFKNNTQQDTTSTSGLENLKTRQENFRFHLEKDENHTANHTTSDKNYNQKMRPLHTGEGKQQKNEGSVTYQPYQYNPSKQWHIATTDHCQTTDENNHSSQMKQSEKKSQQDKIICTHQSSPIPQQNTIHSPKTSEYLNTAEHHPSQETIKSKLMTDLKKHSETSDGRFNINDILSTRDKKQAKRVQEGKQILTTNINERTKFSPPDDKAINSDALKAKQQQLSQAKSGISKISPSNIRNETNPEDGHSSMDRTSIKSGREKHPSKENENNTPRSVSYKENGQTKQEMLTSKLKAHAQKEISAIKEKGLAKQHTLLRNATRQSKAVNDDNGQMNQEVLSRKKEITAEKLNHLFQDITYSTGTFNRDKSDQNKKCLPSEKVETSLKDGTSQDLIKDMTKAHKTESLEKRMTELEKLICDVQDVAENDIHQQHIQITKRQAGRMEQPTQENAAQHEPTPTQHLTPSPSLQSFGNKQLLVKTEEQSDSILPTNNAKFSATAKGNESLQNTDNTENAPPCNKDENTVQIIPLKCTDMTESGLSTQDKLNKAIQEGQMESGAIHEYAEDKQIKYFREVIPPVSSNHLNEKYSAEDVKGLGIQDNTTQASDINKTNILEQIVYNNDPQFMASEKVFKEPRSQKSEVEIQPEYSQKNINPLQEDAKANYVTSMKDEFQRIIETTDLDNQIKVSKAKATPETTKNQDNPPEKAKEHHEKFAATEVKQSEEDCIDNKRVYHGLASTSPHKCCSSNSMKTSDTSETNCTNVQDKSADSIVSAPDSHIIHIASKAENDLTDEPVIYSICVTSKTDVVPEDEPVIFSISVSSIADNANLSTNQNRNDPKHLSSEQDEIVDKGPDHKEAKTDSVCLKNQARKSDVEDKTSKGTIRKRSSPSSKNQLDSKSLLRVDDLSLSYDRLLVKYGFANNDAGQVKTNKKEVLCDKKELTCSSVQNKKSTTDNAQCITTVYNDETKNVSLQSKDPLEVASMFLKEVKENGEQGVTQVKDSHHLVTEENTKRTAGLMANSNEDTESKNQHNDETNRMKKVKLNTLKTKEPNSIVASESMITNSKVVEESQHVVQEGEIIQKGLKENGCKDVLNKNAQQVKFEKDKQMSAKICATGASKLSSKTSDHLHDRSHSPSIKGSVSDVKNKSRLQSGESEGADLYAIQSNQCFKLHGSPKLDYERDLAKPEKPSKESVGGYDQEALKVNLKGSVCKNDSIKQEQVKFMNGSVIKNNTETDESSVSTSKKLKADVSSNEKLDTNVSAFRKSEQSVPQVQNKHEKEKQLHQHSSAFVQDDEIIKKEEKQSEFRCNVGQHKQEIVDNSSPANITGKDTLTLKNIKDHSKLVKMKCKQEPDEDVSRRASGEISTRKLNTSNTTSLVEKDAVNCESWQREILKKETAKSQDETFDHLDNFTPDQLKANEKNMEHGPFKVIDNGKPTENDMKFCDFGERYDNRSNEYQNHPQKPLTDETTENKSNEVTSVGSNHVNQIHSNKDAVLEKYKIVQQQRKWNRPEISALADYARLKVISAEDNCNEKDLLKRMDTHQKYNLSTIQTQNDSLESQIMTGNDKKLPKNVGANAKKILQTFQENDDHVLQKFKIKDGLQNTPDHHGKVIDHQTPRLLDKLEKKICAGEETKCANEMTSTTQMQSDSPHAEDKNDTQTKLQKQPMDDKTLIMETSPQVKKFSKPQKSEGIHDKATEQADNQTNLMMEEKDVETSEEPQYYVVNAIESKQNSKDLHELLPLNYEKKSVKEVATVSAMSPQCNIISPVMGKPTMFRVKDNTSINSSITKTLRPLFHRSVSEEFTRASPKKEICYGSEKVDINHEHLKTYAYHPVSQVQSGASCPLPAVEESQSQKQFSPEFTESKESRSFNIKTDLVPNTKSAHTANLPTSTLGMADTSSQSFETKKEKESNVWPGSQYNERHVSASFKRHGSLFSEGPGAVSYERPKSVSYERPQSVCYERPESVCYERPESACSDIRSLSKPPTVPPKSEKALRRAKRLTYKRVKKTESEIISDNQGQPERKSIQASSSLPASPMEVTSMHQTLLPSPPIAHYHVGTSHAPSLPNIMAHSFPVTQRKLLQDPNSGQYFMVDMPVQVKTKTFFDPETGKYLHLNVQQREQRTLSQPTPVEVVGHPYVMYPGFLPMSVSVPSVPHLRSSSQISAPATLTEAQALETSSKQQPQKPEHHKNIQDYDKSVSKSQEQTLQPDNKHKLMPRHTHIITMSELEDFAVENT